MGNQSWNIASRKIRNPFWKSVFLYTAEMLENIKYYSPNKFGLFPLCNNQTFKIGNENIKAAVFGNKKQIQVWDFMNTNNFRFLTREHFNQNTGLNLNFLKYQSIIMAIKQGTNKINFNIALSEVHQLPRQPLLIDILTKQKKGCKHFNNILRSREVLHHVAIIE